MKSLSRGFLLFLLVSSLSFGADYRGEETVQVNAGDSLFTDLISGSHYVDMLGYINGDMFSACQRLNIEGEVTEDVFAGAQEITIRGKVGDMVVCAGQNITVDGEVGGDVIAFGAEVRVTQRADIKGNLFVGSGKLSLDGGRIDGWVSGGTGDLYLNGSVGDSVKLEAGNVRFGAGYSAPKGTKLTLKKDLDLNTIPNRPENLTVIIRKEKAFYRSSLFYWSIISMFIVGLLISLIFKNFTYNLLKVAGENVLKNTGVGFIFLIAAPIVILILVVLILTIPAALILLALFLIFLYLSSIFSGLYVGKYVFELIGRKEEKPNLILPLLTGLLVIVLLSKLPFIGWLIKLIAISFGMGSFVMYLWGFKKKEQQAA